MNNAQRNSIFLAQSKNVQYLTCVWKQINRSINHSIRKSDDHNVSIQTKIIILVFRSWSEAIFSKLIHTPFGFDLSEIVQIKSKCNSEGIGAGWKLCLEFGLKKASKIGKSSYIPNIKKTMEEIIDEYVIKPSIIRNKIAHGQWVNALNSSNDDINKNITTDIGNLNIVDISKWYEAHKILVNIMEFLIESPKNAFHREYWTELYHLESKLCEMERWTMSSKKAMLQRKPIQIASTI